MISYYDMVIVHGKRLEFNDIQANYDTELSDVIIIMDRGSETLESKYINM